MNGLNSRKNEEIIEINKEMVQEIFMATKKCY